MSWLKYFDVNYLDKSTGDFLSQLDINLPAERTAAIEAAVLPDARSWSVVGRASMQRILASAISATSQELELNFSLIEMPFLRDPLDRRELLQAIWDLVFPEQRPNSSYMDAPRNTRN